MLSKSNINHRKYMHRIKDLLKCYNKNTAKSPLLIEKLFAEISLIPELVEYIKSNDPNETKVLLSQFSSFMQIREFNKGFSFQRILGDNLNNNFIMTLKGTVAEFGIKYVKKSLSFKEYVLFLTKIYLLKEKSLYWDCMRKNVGCFPFDKIKSLVKHWDKKKFFEEEKNVNDKNFMRDINIIELSKEIHTKDFYFIDELQNLKELIMNSRWNKLIKSNSIIHDNNYEDIINSYIELYNYNNNVENGKEIDAVYSNKEKYNVYIPYFFKKRILTPISFIGDLNNPFQTKNYSSFVALENCFIVYINKSKINQDQLIFKYSHYDRFKYIYEVLLSSHQLFKFINSSNLNKLGKYFQLINLKKDEILFHQGELNKGVYIINKGKIELSTNQSYLNLIDLNYDLLHSMDYCTQYITDIKKKEITTSKNFLNGYYDYKSDLNTLMKNPLFSKNSKIKEDIVFCTYNIKDILGLGEIFNYKTNINLFTAKAKCDDTELVFIPREIFKALLSNDSINNKCGQISEEKTKLLRESITKYKNFFEKKINILSGKKNTNMNKLSKAKSFILGKNNSYIENLMNKLNKNEIDFTQNKNSNNNNDKNSMNLIDEERNILSPYKTINSSKILNHKINFNKNQIRKCNDLLSLRKKLISLRQFKNNMLDENNNFNKTALGFNSSFSFINNNSKLNPKNPFPLKNYASTIKSEKKKLFLDKFIKGKNQKINFRCVSAKRLDNSQNFKFKNLFDKSGNLNKSSYNLDINITNKFNRNMLLDNFMNKNNIFAQ